MNPPPAESPAPATPPAAASPPQPRWLPRLVVAALAGILAPFFAWALIASLAPAPLTPPEPARAAELLAEFNHKQTIAVELFLLPVAALLTVLACTGRTDCRLPLRLSTTLALTSGLVISLLIWDHDHPALSRAAWWDVYWRYALLVLTQNLAVTSVQFGIERTVRGFRHLRQAAPEIVTRPTGLGAMAALALYGFCLATTFTSRPWIAGRAPSDAMIDEHLDRYLAAVEAEDGAAATRAPGYRKEARNKVDSGLRAALNAEAVALTADLNPLVVASSIWWYHDDGPPTRRVDLRTGAITYNQWIGSDARITLPDFCHTPDPDPATSDPVTPGTAAPANSRSLLAGIEVKTGFVGGLAGYSGWQIGPADWHLGLRKDDAAPLAILLTVAALLFALTAHFLTNKRTNTPTQTL